MPAAAVIPAPMAYIKVVAVKKLVVGLLPLTVGLPFGYVSGLSWASAWGANLRLTVWVGTHDVYFEEIRVSQAGVCLEYNSME